MKFLISLFFIAAIAVLLIHQGPQQLPEKLVVKTVDSSGRVSIFPIYAGSNIGLVIQQAIESLPDEGGVVLLPGRSWTLDTPMVSEGAQEPL